ncbi:VCBS repeat-containing protein, partial [Candidatus Peribacteria bacterium]|nr:VCBS repeat-containing protein [Candidatus Peribacteria bacterium]
SSANYILGNLSVGMANAAKTKLEVQGTASGSEIFGTRSIGTSGSLVVGTTVRFKSYVSCSALETSSTGALVCGTDDTGTGGGNFGSGNVITLTSNRYVEVQGDTMTGGLLIVSGGHTGLPTIDAGLLLEIGGTASGRSLHAQDTLSSSGKLVILGDILANSVIYKTRGIAFSSGATILQSSGNNEFVNLVHSGLGTNNIVRLTPAGDLVNIGTIQAGEVNLRRGGTFLSKQDYDAGTNPKGIASGDLNGDGNADLVAANNGTNTISVLLNSGTGGFVGKVDYITGTHPRTVAIGDLNGDGTADIAVADDSSTNVYVLINAGSGVFLSPVAYAVGSTPYSVAIGDLNGDGKADLAVANNSSSSISVLLNVGNGTFAANTDYTVSTPTAVVIGDLNGDGKADLAASSIGAPNNVVVLMNKGNGTFAASVDYTAGFSPQSVAIADLNGDRKLDLVVSYFSDTFVSVFINVGRGIFAAKADYATGNISSFVAVGDLNGDGKADIVTSNNSDNTVSVLLNKVNGTFAAKADYITGTGPSEVTIADFNGDGKADLAVANSTPTVSVLMNNSRTAFYVSAGTGGAVGIGTATPGSALAVSGAVIISGNGRLRNGAPDSGIALEVIGTMSGHVIKAMDKLVSSGTLAVQGASVFMSNTTTKGTISGAALQIMGQGGTANYILGNLAIGQTTADAKLDVLGTISGSSLTVSGLNAGNCDVKSTNGVLFCGLDDAGSQASTDLRYVQKSGSVMTGGLLIQNGVIHDTLPTIDAGVLLEVAGVMSGRVLRAQDTLASSGTLSVRGESTLSGALLVGSGARFGKDVTTRGAFSGNALTVSSLKSCGTLYTTTGGVVTCGGTVVKKKTYNQTVNASVVLVEDGDQSWKMGANQTWIFHISNIVRAASAVPGMDFAISAPPDANCNYQVTDIDAAIVGSGSTTCYKQLSVSIPAVSHGTRRWVEVFGTIVNGANAGSGAQRWSQKLSNASNSQVLSGSTLIAFRPVGSDLAEVYRTTDPGVLPGTVVSIDPDLLAGVKRSAAPYDKNMLGVISTDPGLTIGGKDLVDGKGGRPVYLALAGRVPVLVTDEGGPIHAGDYLTSSPTPGYAMRANHGGSIIGQALEDFTEGTHGAITVFVKNTVISALDAEGGLFTETGSMITMHSSLTLSGSLITTGSALFGSGIVIQSSTTDSSQNLFQISSGVHSGSGGGLDPVFRVTAGGDAFADGAFTGGGADYAEWFTTADADLKFGEAVCIDITRANSVRRCTRSGDGDIIGLVSSSEQAAFIGNKFSGAEGLPVPGTVLVGLLGQLSADMVVESGSTIRPGDALAAGSLPGTLRKAFAGESTVGVALEGIDSGRGMRKVLISRKNQSVTAESVSERVMQTVKDLKIEDELMLSLQQAVRNFSASGTLIEPIAQEVQRQVSALSIESITDRLATLESRIAALSGSLADGSGRSARGILEGGSQAGMPAPMGGDSLALSGSLTANALRAQTLSLDQNLTAVDGRFAGDLYVDGIFNVRDLYVPNGVRIDGGISAGSIEVESGAVINGTLTLNSELNLTKGMVFASGSLLTAHDIIVKSALQVLGPITIQGLASFLGDVQIKGQLTLSNRQAGYAEIPATGTSVSIRFTTPLTGEPVVTVTPNGRVGSEWWTESVTASGFTISIDKPARNTVRFSWTALTTSGAELTTGNVGEASVENGLLTFQVDSHGVPVSSDAAWNSCIRNHPLLTGDGSPISCSAYHDAYVWEHPDLRIRFTYNTSLNPALLQLPEGYVVEVVGGTEEGTESSSSSSEQPVESSSSSSVSSEESSSSSSVSSESSSSEESSSSSEESSSSSSDEGEELFTPLPPEGEEGG